LLTKHITHLYLKVGMKQALIFSFFLTWFLTPSSHKFKAKSEKTKQLVPQKLA